MSEIPTFRNREEYLKFVRKLKSKNRLHDAVEKRLVELLSMIFPDAHSTSEVAGILGGRNDLMQFFFNGRRVVFELFFSPSQVPQDLRLLEQSHANVKIAILLDSDVNAKLANEYFRKKPDHFEYLWLWDVLNKENQAFCLARLKEIISENHLLVRLRNLLATPARELIEQRFRSQLESIEEHLSLHPPSQINLQELTGSQIAALIVVSELHKMGIPREKLRPLLAWLKNSVEFAFTLVLHGFQAFLVTDLKEYNAIWSDGDLADDIILGAEDSAEVRIVMCLNKVINSILKAGGMEPAQLQWHFFHAYEENIAHIEPAKWLKGKVNPIVKTTKGEE